MLFKATLSSAIMALLLAAQSAAVALPNPEPETAIENVPEALKALHERASGAKVTFTVCNGPLNSLGQFSYCGYSAAYVGNDGYLDSVTWKSAGAYLCLYEAFKSHSNSAGFGFNANNDNKSAVFNKKGSITLEPPKSEYKGTAYVEVVCKAIFGHSNNDASSFIMLWQPTTMLPKP